MKALSRSTGQLAFVRLHTARHIRRLHRLRQRSHHYGFAAYEAQFINAIARTGRIRAILRDLRKGCSHIHS